MLVPDDRMTVVDFCPGVSRVRFESDALPAVARMFNFVPSRASTVNSRTVTFFLSTARICPVAVAPLAITRSPPTVTSLTTANCSTVPGAAPTMTSDCSDKDTGSASGTVTSSTTVSTAGAAVGEADGVAPRPLAAVVAVGVGVGFAVGVGEAFAFPLTAAGVATGVAVGVTDAVGVGASGVGVAVADGVG